jgi:hypothetical protein
MHLLDRDTSAWFGPSGSAVFMDELKLVMEEGLMKQAKDSFEPEWFPPAFRELANARWAEYSLYRELTPESGQAERGTLFWEFTKRICTLCCATPSPVSFDIVRFQIGELHILTVESLLKEMRSRGSVRAGPR